MANRHIKMFMLNFVVGTGFFITSLGFTTLIGAMLGQQLRGTLEELGTGVGTANVGLIVSVILSFIITGILIWFWAKSRIWIGEKLLGMERLGHEPKLETRKKVGLLVTIISIGIVTSLVMVGFNDFISKVSPSTDLSNPSSLLTALSKYDLPLLVGVIFTIGIFGAIVTLLGHLIYPIQHKISETLS